MILDFLAARLDAKALDFLEQRSEEIANGVSKHRFAELISLASRYARRKPLALSLAECEVAGESITGWNPERWNLLELLRVALILAHPDLMEYSFAEALEDCFRYADEGELCALYRSLALLPDGERFCRRGAEGCRTNMISVFEAVACDTPYPVRHFDDIAWRQLVIKTVFIDAPLWRVYGLDTRLSPELTRMALDLADERRSAGRLIPPQLWLCLGKYGGDRSADALEKELQVSSPAAHQAALLALGRAGAISQLQRLMQTETDSLSRTMIKQALDGRTDQTSFRELDSQRM